MSALLNQDLGFDEVRWATLRKPSYDSGVSFQGLPQKTLLPAGTRLFRLVKMVTGIYFDAVWWIPEPVFRELHDDANLSARGGGRLFRNYVAEYLALPSADTQLCVVEIQLTTSVYGWTGRSSPLFDRPGGMEQADDSDKVDQNLPDALCRLKNAHGPCCRRGRNKGGDRPKTHFQSPVSTKPAQ